MTKYAILLVCFSVLLATSCHISSKTNSTSQQKGNTEATPQDIPYQIAERYFVLNTYKDGDLANPKITDKETFDRFFNTARVMGKNGKPTEIDFSKQYVLAIIAEESNRNPVITVKSLTKSDQKIYLKYRITLGEEPSSPAAAVIRPVLLLLVDNKYQGELIITPDL